MVSHNRINSVRRTQHSQGIKLPVNFVDTVIHNVSGQKDNVGIKPVNLVNDIVNTAHRGRPIDVEVTELDNGKFTINQRGLNIQRINGGRAHSFVNAVYAKKKRGQNRNHIGTGKHADVFGIKRPAAAADNFGYAIQRVPYDVADNEHKQKQKNKTK